ncbi:hypothetical protein HKX48_003582 [Thoreauomyces humboldtii]|nr:hypothetical protein HKX48_003582 [Thoreauomyces humboldtii]
MHRYDDHDDSMTLTGKPRKRLTQSCDRCKAKKRRCEGAHPCANCVKAKATCTMLIEQKKRGPKRSAPGGHGAGGGARRRRRTTRTASSAGVRDNDRFVPPSASAAMYNESDDESDHQAVSEEEDDQSEEEQSNDEAQEEEDVDFEDDDEIRDDDNESKAPPSIVQPLPRIATSFAPSAVDLLYEPREDASSFSLLDSAQASAASFFDELDGYAAAGMDNESLAMDAAQRPVDPAAVDASTLSGFSAPALPPAWITAPLSSQMFFSGLQSHTHQAQQPPALRRESTIPSAYGTQFPDQPSLSFSRPLTPLAVEERSQVPPPAIATCLDDKADFHLHLINLFLLYFHPTYPVLHETSFLESLTSDGSDPSRPKVSQALLNAVYSIGVLYSKHPHTTQLGGRSVASTIFGQRAHGQLTSAKDLVARCLLDIRDFGAVAAGGGEMELFPGTWRIAQKVKLAYDAPCDSLYSIVNGRPQSENGITSDDGELQTLVGRKRAWWGLFSMDTFVGLSTGYDLTIDESLYMDSLLDTETLVRSSPHPLAAEKALLESRYGWSASSGASRSNRSSMASNTFSSHTAQQARQFDWSALLGEQATHTLFNLPQLSSSPQVICTPLSDVHPHIRLSIFMRRVMRSVIRSTPSAQTSSYIAALHAKLMQFPQSFSPNVQRYLQSQTLMYARDDEEALTATSVHTLLMFFATMTLIHQSALNDQQTRHAMYDAPQQRLTSLQVCEAVYTRVNRLVEDVYARRYAHHDTSADQPFAPPPPQELVATPFTAVLLTIPVVPLLESRAHASALTIPIPGALPCLEQTILPTLDDMAIVWPRASRYGAGLRGWAEVVRERGVAEQVGQSANVQGSWKRDNPFPSNGLELGFDL